MKKKFILFSMLLLTLLNSPFAQEKKEWKEMNAFHTIMGKTFHPTEEGNLKPLKEHIDILVAKAKAWQASTTPKGYNATTTKPILQKLVKKCTAIKKAIVAKQSDEELKKLIAQAHDIFHEIMEKCIKEEHQ